MANKSTIRTFAQLVFICTIVCSGTSSTVAPSSSRTSFPSLTPTLNPNYNLSVTTTASPTATSTDNTLDGAGHDHGGNDMFQLGIGLGVCCIFVISVVTILYVRICKKNKLTVSNLHDPNIEMDHNITPQLSTSEVTTEMDANQTRDRQKSDVELPRVRAESILIVFADDENKNANVDDGEGTKGDLSTIAENNETKKEGFAIKYTETTGPRTDSKANEEDAANDVEVIGDENETAKEADVETKE